MIITHLFPFFSDDSLTVHIKVTAISFSVSLICNTVQLDFANEASASWTAKAGSLTSTTVMPIEAQFFIRYLPVMG